LSHRGFSFHDRTDHSISNHGVLNVRSV